MALWAKTGRSLRTSTKILVRAASSRIVYDMMRSADVMASTTMISIRLKPAWRESRLCFIFRSPGDERPVLVERVMQREPGTIPLHANEVVPLGERGLRRVPRVAQATGDDLRRLRRFHARRGRLVVLHVEP